MNVVSVIVVREGKNVEKRRLKKHYSVKGRSTKDKLEGTTINRSWLN